LRLCGGLDESGIRVPRLREGFLMDIQLLCW
jgi:hypothetical protein